MTPEEANKISIKHYLETLNIRSVKEKNAYGMYLSPFRAEQAPSFKVDYRQNLWYDFGSGEGGTMVDLVMKMHRCSFHEAMLKLENQKGEIPSFSFHGNQTNRELILKEVIPLTHPALTGYLKKRRINTDTAKGYCKEIHYRINGRDYFAIGFKNNAGGYELRNPYFKGTISPKGITTINPNNENTDTCILFEGFTDYLSYLTIKEIHTPGSDVVVLNSIIYLEPSVELLKKYASVHAFPDNDESGKRALKKLQEQHKNVSDHSKFYSNYKDLNEYLCSEFPMEKYTGLQGLEIIR